MPRRHRGSIRERILPDGSQRFDVRIELPPHPLTGARRPHSKTFATYDEAERERTRWLSELDGDVVIAPSRITVAELLRRWLDDEAALSVRATTLEDYRFSIEKHVIPRLGTKRAQSLAPADVASFKAAMMREAGTRTTQLALLRLKQALTWGVGVELLKRNVASGVKPPRETVTEKRALSHAEARAFLELAETDTYSPLWRVYLATGLRRGEGLGLRWKDLDLVAHTIAVQQQVVLAGTPARPTIQMPKSIAARRVLDLDQTTVEAISAHAEKQAEFRKRAMLWKNLDLIFCTRNGLPLNPNNIIRNFNVLRDLAGLDPGITIHSLRHTHATHLLLAGVPVSIVSKRLGHSKTSITLDTYAHLLPGYGGMALEAIRAALDGGLPELEAPR